MTNWSDAFHREGFEVAVETNGTQSAPRGLDWICVSPKADAPLTLTSGNELKLVYPQPLAMPERFAGMDFEHFFLQPMDGPEVAENTRAVIDYCKRHPSLATQPSGPQAAWYSVNPSWRPCMPAKMASADGRMR